MSPHQIDWWLIASTIVTALGVVAAILFSIWQVWQNRQRDLRQQAEGVAAWLSSPVVSPANGDVLVNLINISTTPIFDVVVGVVRLQGAVSDGLLRHELLATVPPGESWAVLSGDDLDSSMNRRFGTEIAFTDQAGHHWQRDVRGKLDRIKSTPPDYYDLPRPHGHGIVHTRKPAGRNARGEITYDPRS